MSTRRALVVDDESQAHADIAGRLSNFFSAVDVAEDIQKAWSYLSANDYELVTIDLSLVAGVKVMSVVPNQKGFELLQRIRRSGREAPTAIVVITGYPTTTRVRDAFAEYDVDDFIEKPFFGDDFITRIRRVLVKGRIRAAERRLTNRHRATITASGTELISSEISGPQQKSRVLIKPRARLDLASFGRRADELEPLIRTGGGQWRQEAKQIGGDLFRTLMSRPAVSQIISAARQLSTRNTPAVLEFAGPSELLRVPFELMTSDNDFLCFESIITRRLTIGDIPGAKARPFHRVVAHLLETDQPLNVLLIGVNSDGKIGAVMEEVSEIESTIRRSLDGIGIPHTVATLIESAATYENVCDRLTDGNVHVLHFAGHGRFDEAMPENSGVVVDVGHCAEILSAGTLKSLLSGSGVELAVLSCCAGARTGDARQGDFHGILEALARAGVPTVLGHRWTVPDAPARAFAVTFYEELMATLSPGAALLRARNAAAANRAGGRDNSMWACPVLVSLVEP